MRLRSDGRAAGPDCAGREADPVRPSAKVKRRAGLHKSEAEPAPSPIDATKDVKSTDESATDATLSKRKRRRPRTLSMPRKRRRLDRSSPEPNSDRSEV